MAKTKYSAHSNNTKSFDFKKKVTESTRTTTRKNNLDEQNKRESLARLLKMADKSTMSSKRVMEIDLGMDRVRALNRSFDGAVMSSTIANIDIEELVYAFSGYVASQVVVVQQPKTHYVREDVANNREDIEDEVGEILKESFLHPLYKADNEP